MCGQVGRPGTGHPLRGQNNVQGASDAGLIQCFTDYQSVSDDGVRSSFAEIWNSDCVDPEKGLTVTEIMDAIHDIEFRQCIFWVKTRRCLIQM